MSDLNISNFSNLASIDPRLPGIGTSWLYRMPFFYTYFANTTFEKVNLKGAYCGIAPHEGSFKIFIGSMFNECTSVKTLEGMLIHEYLHLIMASFDRQGDRNHKGWNCATDYAINEEVINHSYDGEKMELPEHVLLFKDLQAFGYPGECVAEKIYDWMAEQAQKKGQGDGQGDQQSDDDGDGGGDGQENKDGASVGPDGKKNFDSHSGLDELKDAIRDNPMVSTKVKKMFETAKANQEIQKGIGSNSGSIYTFIDSISKPSVRWRGILHSTVQSHVKGSGHKVYNWGKKNRKGLPFPGKKRYNKKVVLAVDTSGSIDDKLAGRFFSEIDKIADDHEIKLIQFDTVVQSKSNYKKGDWRKIKFTGRGGTSCKELFENVIKDKALSRTTIVVFSDGGFYKDYQTFNLDIIWTIFGSTDACTGGKIIEIKDF